MNDVRIASLEWTKSTHFGKRKYFYYTEKCNQRKSRHKRKKEKKKRQKFFNVFLIKNIRVSEHFTLSSFVLRLNKCTVDERE